MRNIGLLFLAVMIFFGGRLYSQELEVLLDSGNIYLDKKQYEDVIRVLTIFIEEDDGELEAYAIRAFAFYHLSRFEEALSDCNFALALHEGYAEIYNLRGLCKDQLGNRVEACADWHLAYAYGLNAAMRLIKNLCKDINSE